MKASDLGKIVVDGLIGSSFDFMDPDFTAKMEEELDEVEAGKLERVALLDRFYKRFTGRLDAAKKRDRWAPDPERTDFKCDDCGSSMLKRWSKNGWFLGCEAYPKCKFTQDLDEHGKPAKPKLTDYKCDACERPMVIKTGRFGEFLSCSGYPECKNAKPVPLGVPCPKCAGDMIEIRPKKRGGRPFYGCANYPKCDFKVWQKPVAEPCPLCNHPFLVVTGKKTPKLTCPRGKECGYARGVDEPAPEGGDDDRKAGGGKRDTAPVEDAPPASP
jgi:DNA topoisomerase I